MLPDASRRLRQDESGAIAESRFRRMRTALSLARSGLSNQCRVPVQYSEAYISNHFDDLAALKRSGAGIRRRRQVGGDGESPGGCGQILSGHNSSWQRNHARRGCLIDEMVGVADRSTWSEAIPKLVNQLDAETCRETAASLETLDSQRQTWDELMQQEKPGRTRLFAAARTALRHHRMAGH